MSSLINRMRFSTTITKETLKALAEYSKKTMIPISKIVDKAIIEYLSKQS